MFQSQIVGPNWGPAGRQIDPARWAHLGQEGQEGVTEVLAGRQVEEQQHDDLHHGHVREVGREVAQEVRRQVRHQPQHVAPGPRAAPCGGRGGGAGALQSPIPFAGCALKQVAIGGGGEAPATEQPCFFWLCLLPPGSVHRRGLGLTSKRQTAHMFFEEKKESCNDLSLPYLLMG